MRMLLALIAAAMFAVPAYAQTAQPTPRLTTEQRFDQANITNDGQLTLEQAKAKYKTVARHFATIDHDKKGYVTLDDVRSYYKMRRALHRSTASAPREPKS